jgi:hypothetical protein
MMWTVRFFRATETLSYVFTAVAVFTGIWAESWYYLPGPPEAKSLRIYDSPTFLEAESIAQFLDEHSTPDEPIFILADEPQILYYAHRKSSSRYFFPQPAFWSSRRQQEILDDLHRRPPKLVVVLLDVGLSSMVQHSTALRDFFRDIKSLLVESYQIVAGLPDKPDAAGRTQLHVLADKAGPPRQSSTGYIASIWKRKNSASELK